VTAILLCLVVCWGCAGGASAPPPGGDDSSGDGSDDGTGGDTDDGTDDGGDGSGTPTSTGLVFIHHSVGEDWLNNGLETALQAKSYIGTTREITYGTEVPPDQGRPDTLGSPAGDATDIGHWIYWFNDYMRSVRSFGGTNGIVMIKPCFPNSAITSAGTPPGNAFSGDANLADFQAVFRNPAGRGIIYTHDAYAYAALADAFADQPTTLFVICTPPPLHPDSTNAADAARARQFATWLATTWLNQYNADHPTIHNVAVFDLFDVLANPDDGSATANMLRADYIPEPGNSHPNATANAAMTAAFATGSGNVLDAAWAAFAGS
jgi:hypothetical protein